MVSTNWSGKRAQKLVKRVATRIVGMEMYIIRAIPKRRVREISKLDYFFKDLRRNQAGRSKQSLRTGINTGSREAAVLLNPFTLVVAGIPKQ